MSRRSVTKLASLLALVAIVIIGVYYVPLTMFSVQPKPEQTPQKIYDYYIIVEEDTKEVLMYVPVVVSIGDELVSDQNKRYKIVKIEENQAYARFVEDLNLELYKK
ncbi:stage II sporulation protein P [Sporomusa sp. KB1]|uniref:stage II sporulation protein P n=1 Tax=Sporomusa sp. KB1 TaxID=943346 RepID=UPI0011A30627|nr:stage II sporulation protein P [Sporomusa sp. KB1]TWH47000.1 stage II sporulation protein P [Sporomusa sp. KB1]